MDTGPLLGVLLGLAALWVGIVAILWLLRPKGVPVREILSVVPDVLRLGRSVLTDVRAPLDVRAVVAITALWIISPVDLIPEFLPVIGPLDDVVVTVLALRYVRRRLGVDAVRARWTGTDDGFRVLVRLMGGRA